MNEFLFISLAYLSGSIPFGLILSRVFGGVDVRTIGSGNIGATNVLRTGRKSLAAATLLCDVLKGFMPVYLAHHWGMDGIALLGTACAAVVGHVFPVWLKFRGGKGVATALGVFWSLSLPLGIFTTLVWIILNQFFRISSLSALGAFLLSPVFTAFFFCRSLAFFCLGITFLIFWTHRTNIQRLLAGQEGKIQG